MLTNRELTTVLAALRYWQRDLESADEIIDGGEHFADQQFDRLALGLSVHHPAPLATSKSPGRAFEPYGLPDLPGRFFIRPNRK